MWKYTVQHDSGLFLVNDGFDYWSDNFPRWGHFVHAMEFPDPQSARRQCIKWRGRRVLRNFGTSDVRECFVNENAEIAEKKV